MGTSVAIPVGVEEWMDSVKALPNATLTFIRPTRMTPALRWAATDVAHQLMFVSHCRVMMATQ